MDSDMDVVVYTAERQSASIVTSLLSAWQDVRRGRHMLRHIFIRDFITQFRQRLLGYLWAVLTPLLGLVSFLFMYIVGVLRPGVSSIPYPLYLFVGVSLWTVTTTVLQAVGASLLSQADLMLRTNVPPIVLACSAVVSLLYANVINIVSIFLLSFAFGVIPSPWALLYPVLMLPLFLFGIGAGLLLAVLSASARDVTNIVLTVFSFVLYLSPVYFSTDMFHWPLSLVVAVNPFTYMINVPRDLFFQGHTDYWTGYSIVTLIAALVFVCGIHGFYMVKDKVAERL